MSELPKLKVRRDWNPVEETYDLEQARDLLFGQGTDMLVIVEGETVHSYEELLQLATRDSYRNRDSLEVMVLSAGLVDGG